MSTFRQIAKGKKAFTVYDVLLDPDAETPEKIGFRILSAAEQGDIIKQAEEWAEGKGSKSTAGQGDPRFELAKKAFTVALACVDSESPQDSPAPYFPKGAAQVFEAFDDDVIEYLYAIWLTHREKRSPRKLRENTIEFIEGLANTINPDEDAAAVFFSRWPLGTLIRFTRILGSQFVTSQQINSGSSTPSEAEPQS